MCGSPVVMGNLWFYFFLLHHCDCFIYNIVLKDFESSSTHFFQSEIDQFNLSHCQTLQIYSNLFSLNYFSFTISCESKIDIQTLQSQLTNVKYFERSIELAVAHLDKLHLSPQQPRSDIPDLSHYNYCTITYDVFHSLSSDTPSRSPPIVSCE
jgi:hypothetical protein